MATKVATFQQGVGGYSQTVDTMLVPAATTQNNAAAQSLIVDKGGEQTLLRFDGIFGSLASQVPPGATIVSATLTLQTTDAGDGADLHRMKVAWSDTATFASMTNGVQANGTEALSGTASAISKPSVGPTVIDVTSSVQAWMDGAANYGWVFLSKGTNGWDFSSSEGSTPPKLTIVYSVPDTNSPPVGVDDSATLANSSVVDLAVLGNDTDPDGDTLSVLAVTTGPAHGSASINSNGSIHYDPAAGFVGTDSLVYSLSDGRGGTSQATVHLTVTASNAPPAAQGDVATTNEDTPVTIQVLANDSDPDGDALSVSGIAIGPTHGTAVVNGDGTLNYTPAANYFGSDALTYSVSDGHGGSSQASVSITVASVNDAPKAVADTASVQNGSSISIAVLSNDTDTDGDPLVVSGVGNAGHGSVVLNSNQTIDYTPAAGFVGSDAFTYSVSDGHGGTANASVAVTVTAANTGPQTITFKQNVGGYTGTVDTILVQASPTQLNGSNPTLGVDKSTDVQTLLRFDGLFGASGSQIPAGATISSATLTLQSTNAGNGATVYRMLQPWSDSATWSSFVNGVQANGLEAMSSQGINVPTTKIGVTTIDVTTSLQAWANGAPNNGWVFISKGTDGWDFYSAEGTTPPQLTVTYTLPSANSPPVAVPDSATLAEDGSVIIAVLANDTDSNGDALVVTAIGTGPQHGAAVLNGNGTISYTPAPNYFGSDSLTYSISDGHGGSATGTVNLTVTPVNDAPSAVHDTASTSEDTPIVIAVLSNDTDIEGDSLTITGIGTAPAHGTAGTNPNGSITYTPDSNYNGADSFTYLISDGHGGSSTATVDVAISATNDNPVALDDAVSVNENQSVAVAVLANDSDVDADSLIVTGIGTAPQHGSAVVNPNGTVTYTPTAFYFGTDSFAYAISDGHGGTATAIARITISAVNSTPTAADDSATVSEDGSVVIAPLANDTDPDSDPLTIAAIDSGPGHGTVLINPNDTLTYTPDADYFGSDAFGYRVSDGHGGSATATVSITVSAVNDAPVASPDTVALNEDGAAIINVLANDTDVEGDPLTVSAVTAAPSHGTAVINPNSTITYTPDADYFGPDSIGYTVQDGHGGTASATVSITVNAVNDAPTAAADTAVVDEDGAVVLQVLSNDTDVEGDALTVSGITTAPAHGSAAVNSDGTITYTPNADYFGGDSFIYSVGDGHGGAASASVTISVAAVNDAPIANDDTYSLAEDGAVALQVLANDTDADGDGIALTGISVGPSHGTAVLGSSGTVTYTPSHDYFGQDSFIYSVSDGHGGTASGTVNLTVTPVNDAPIALADAFATGEDTAIALAVLANDSDVDGDTVSIAAITGAPQHGTALINGTTISYTPAANYFGTDALTYRISDGHGGVATAVANITIASVNDSPVAGADGASTQTGTAVTINVLANDSDVDGDPVTLTSAGAPHHGSVAVNANHTITYSPDAGFSGTDTFAYGIADGRGGTATGTVSVTVTSTALYASYIASKIGSGAPQRVFEHDNATKSFFFDGTWWAVLPDSGSWSIHRYSGSTPNTGTLGGWTVASDILQSNKLRADLVWDPVHEKVYILQSSTSTAPHLYELTYNSSTSSWNVATDVKLGGSGSVLSATMWTNNGEVALGLDQFGNPVVTAIASSSQGTQGLHLAYATSADLSTWSYVTLDTQTKGNGGTNGDSKADIITFSDNGVEKIGVIYSRDGSGSDDDWSLAWHDASANAANYGSGWTTDVANSDVHIDNHVSAVSEGDTMYVAIKDDNNSIWLLKGNPGNWQDPILVVNGSQHEPSRPTLVIDDTHQTLYVFYQQNTGSPTGDIYMKVASLSDPHFNPASLGQLIIEGTNTNNNFIDPQAPAQHVGADTDDYFLLLAKNDSTSEIWYNDVHLDGTLIA